HPTSASWEKNSVTQYAQPSNSAFTSPTANPPTGRTAAHRLHGAHLRERGITTGYWRKEKAHFLSVSHSDKLRMMPQCHCAYSLLQSTWPQSLWALSEVPRWHTDCAGMMGGGHIRYSDLKEAAAAAASFKSPSRP